jgi:hypothetical protein
MKTRIERALAVAGVAFLMSATASAQPGTMEKAAQILYRQTRAGRGEFITYLSGAAAAYRWASTDGEAKIAALYCPPDDAKFDGRAWGKIALEEYGRDKRQYGALPGYPLDVFALALLHGLQTRFPCPAAAPASAAAAAAGANP